MTWSDLLRRCFAIDVLKCPRCGGRRELISLIQDSKTITHILDHVGLSSSPPRFQAARSPPEDEWAESAWD